MVINKILKERYQKRKTNGNYAREVLFHRFAFREWLQMRDTFYVR